MSILLLILAITILVIAFVVIQLILIQGTESWNDAVAGCCIAILVMEAAAFIIGVLWWAITYVCAYFHL